MRATYYISFNGADYTQIYPSNAPKVTLTQEPGEIFMRWRVDLFRITATKNATAYATLSAWFFDPTKFLTEINYRIKENGATTYEFKDSILAGDINDQNSVYFCTPAPDDDYRDIMLQYDKTWQNSIANTVFNISNTFYYPVLDTGTFTNNTFDVFTDVAKSVAWGNTASGKETARNALPYTTAAGDIITVIIKNFAGGTVYMEVLNAAFALVSTTATITANGKYEITVQANGTMTEVYNTIISSGSFDYEIYYPTSKASGGLLEDCIDDIINSPSLMDLTYTVVSTYLWNDALGSDPPPTINTYITANPTKDYVIKGTSNWNKLWLARTDSFTTAKEAYFRMSLKDLMLIIKTKLRAWWFIDEDGNFRIEHEYYFRDQTAQANLTTGFATDKPEVDARLYSYDRSDVFTQLNYNEANESNPDWLSLPIEFEPLETSRNTNDPNISNLTTDFKYLSTTPGASSLGVTLLKCKAMGAKMLVEINESTKTAGNFYANARLGWYYLFANYWGYFADAKDGTVNGGAFSFDGVKEYLKQRDVSFHPSAAINWKKPFTMALGTGWIQNAEYYPETGMASINVGYDPYL